ncbi:MAG: hypothetical protein N3F07_03290 [Candidatus Micrarchaeota archaeon]|nr:hypothetical protein [Candidatus Micrarchaeota archaeon]
MYLPEHELKMWNSRLYCAYCIMDIQDEEDLLHRRHSKPERHSGSEGREQEFGKEKGACERCGRQSDALYQHLGKKLCASCHSDSKSPPGEGHAPFGVFLQQQLVGSARQFAAGLGSPKKAILPDGQRNPKRKSIWERIFSFFGLRK